MRWPDFLRRLFATWSWQWRSEEAAARNRILAAARELEPERRRELESLVPCVRLWLLGILNAQYSGMLLEDYVDNLTHRTFGQLYAILLSSLLYERYAGTGHLTPSIAALKKVSPEPATIDRTLETLETNSEQPFPLRAGALWQEVRAVLELQDDSSLVGLWFRHEAAERNRSIGNKVDLIEGTGS